MRFKEFTSCLICFFFADLALGGPTLKPHVHGNARLTIAIDTPTTASIDLDAPGDSILGFEHPARTSTEKQMVDGAFNSLRKNGGKLVQFNPSLGCEFKVKMVGLEKEEAAEENSEGATGRHQDVNASYQVTCKKPLSGTAAEIGLMGIFPRVKKITVQVLSENAQFEKTFTSDLGSVQF